MCGLAGAFRIEIDIDAMLDTIAHRGPDGRGHTVIDDTTLGHIRLAIQDTSDAAAQPLTIGDTTITYNGEAWNVAELRAELPGPWTTTGDTEAIAALIARHGAAGLARIHGMFALAWHGPDGTWLARDRYGKIPLHAVRRNGTWLWASELKALPYGVPATSVPPGTAVHLDTGTIHTWTDPPCPADPDPGTVLTLLRDGVAARLRSDRPVCFLLSGGLDSSLVLALARDLHPNPVAYTAVYDTDSADLHAARTVAAHLDVPLIEVNIPEPTYAAVTDAVRTVEVAMKAQIEVAVANLPLAHAIAGDGFRVALSGEAADELFGGYGNMAIASSNADDEAWRQIRYRQLAKMARGNFMRVNKVFMAAGVEARLPYMHRPLVETVLAADKAACPPGKRLLKHAALNVIPDKIINRAKDTFQGGTGITAAAAALTPSPARFYNAEARRIFGYLPRR